MYGITQWQMQPHPGQLLQSVSGQAHRRRSCLRRQVLEEGVRVHKG